MQKLLTWIDERFPLTALWESQWGKYIAPKNFNFWYYFGSLAAFTLVVQIVTGIFLTMNYKPDATKAFESVEYIMRDVSWGWLIRYMHSTGASMFFIVVYLHMFRGLMYGSYRKPRELTWIFGCVIYLCLMAEAFFGYLLPWVRCPLGCAGHRQPVSAVPIIGEDLGVWIRGDYISDITLNRFFAFHVIAVPLVLLGLVVAHLMALHETGSNNPDGVEIKQPKDPDRPAARRHLFAPVLHGEGYRRRRRLLAVFSAIMFFVPDMGGYFLEANNFIPADPLKTPSTSHRYGISRRIRDAARSAFVLAANLGRAGDGRRRVDLLRAAVARSQSGEVDSLSRRAARWLAAFVVSFRSWATSASSRSRSGPVSGELAAARPPTARRSRGVLTIVYFLFFVLMPWYTARDKTKPEPDRVTGQWPCATSCRSSPCSSLRSPARLSLRAAPTSAWSLRRSIV
jgi:ubiquinol-cytochrome c reductase cytochrome b subunit